MSPVVPRRLCSAPLHVCDVCLCLAERVGLRRPRRPSSVLSLLIFSLRYLHRRRSPGPLLHSLATPACRSRCAGRPPASPRAPRARQAPKPAMARAPPPRLLNDPVSRDASPTVAGSLFDERSDTGGFYLRVELFNEPSSHHHPPRAGGPQGPVRASLTLVRRSSMSSCEDASGVQDATPVPPDRSLVTEVGCGAADVMLLNELALPNGPRLAL